jgi:20S proteasome subunit beta 5
MFPQLKQTNHDFTNLINNQQSFEIPPVTNPGTFIDDVFQREDSPKKIEFAHGTTTLGFVYQGGIVIAVDSRASMGQYISSQSTKKVIEINNYLLGTMAGGAADCSYWQRELGRRCRLYQLRNNNRISVAAASKLLAQICYENRDKKLGIYSMIAGWDETGPKLYCIEGDGTRLCGKLFSLGSGSSFAYPIVDSEYRHDLTKTEAIDLGRKAVYIATHRDAYSGGTINVYHIDEKGWELISSQDMNNYDYLGHKKIELQ